MAVMRSLTLLCAVTYASASAVNLTPDNFDQLVLKSGKSAFIKFFAPWCGHCKKMAPDWDTLGTEFADSKTVLIGDVDCTAAGKPLCDKFGVKGFPTIKYFNAPDEEGEDYKGGRTLDDMRKFASSELGPGCSVDTMDNCSDAQKKELETYIAMPEGERATMMSELKSQLGEAEAAHEILLKDLQAKYKESMESLEKLKENSAPKIKMLKASTPAPKAAGKDEV